MADSWVPNPRASEYGQPPQIFHSTPRADITRQGRGYGVVVRDGFIIYGMKSDGAVFPSWRPTLRMAARRARRMLAAYKKTRQQRPLITDMIRAELNAGLERNAAELRSKGE
ncbi:MAG: hypothetical protein ABI067_17615 [Leifsonia sp.]